MVPRTFLIFMLMRSLYCKPSYLIFNSTDNFLSPLFLCVSKIQSILHHELVGRVQNKVYVYFYFFGIFGVFLQKIVFLLFSFIFLFVCAQQNINQSETVIGDKELSVEPYRVSNHVRKIPWWRLVRIPWYPGQEPISWVSRMNEQVYEWSPKKIKVRQKKHELCCGHIITKEKLRKSASTIFIYLSIYFTISKKYNTIVTIIIV